MRKNGKFILAGILTTLWLAGMIIGGSIPSSLVSFDEENEADFAEIKGREETLGIPLMAAEDEPIFIDGDDSANNWTMCDAVTGSGIEA
ncbi:MAG: hypothetical protein ACTSVZ_13170, partial [Promethearchaeota archaeon]